MQTWRFTLKPLSAFATPLMGDTLFGQLCWTVRHLAGEERLTELLSTYTEGSPFCVLSDGFPTGHIPRPHLPIFSMSSSEDSNAQDRKAGKKKMWMSVDDCLKPVSEWLSFCKSADELYGTDYDKLKEEARMHNSINRMTGTTGEGGFAPFAVTQQWYRPDTLLDVHVVINPARFSIDEMEDALKYIGSSGYGKDASTGRGQFTVERKSSHDPYAHSNSDAWLTLSPCAPQGLGFNEDKSYWQLFTRFGRHGSLAAVGGQPFKNPVLLARAGSVFTPQEFSQVHFIGQGLGGNGELSKSITGTVHQGYAPVIGLHLVDVHQRIAESCSWEIV